MSSLVVCAVHDSVAKTFGTPFFSSNVECALRDFSRATNDPISHLYSSPSDFTLYHIADYDNDSGILIPHVPHLYLGRASMFVKSIDRGENHV